MGHWGPGCRGARAAKLALELGACLPQLLKSGCGAPVATKQPFKGRNRFVTLLPHAQIGKFVGQGGPGKTFFSFFFLTCISKLHKGDQGQLGRVPSGHHVMSVSEQDSLPESLLSYLTY